MNSFIFLNLGDKDLYFFLIFSTISLDGEGDQEDN